MVWCVWEILGDVLGLKIRKLYWSQILKTNLSNFVRIIQLKKTKWNLYKEQNIGYMMEKP
jgi:hypothetical protein